MKNQDGDLMDDQIIYVTLELDKFKKKAENCITDLDKLIFTMKEAHTVQQPTQFPIFWTEEWLKVAIEELDTRRMTPEEYTAYVMTVSNNAIALDMEKQRTEEAVKLATERVEKETTERLIKTMILKALKYGKLSDMEIADYNGVSLEFVKQVKLEMGS